MILTSLLYVCMWSPIGLWTPHVPAQDIDTSKTLYAKADHPGSGETKPMNLVDASLPPGGAGAQPARARPTPAPPRRVRHAGLGNTLPLQSELNHSEHEQA